MDDSYCCACGVYIPEGSQICKNCNSKLQINSTKEFKKETRSPIDIIMLVAIVGWIVLLLISALSVK